MAQVLERQVAAISDANGTATFTFQAPPTGFWWTGTLTCPDAPTGALFTATIGATQWGQWGGNSVYGPVQAQANRQLTITATGLLASTNYVLTWLGQEESVQASEVLWPAANSTALTALTTPIAPQQLLSSPVSAVPYSTLVNIPTGIRTLIISMNYVGGTFTNPFTLNVTGDVSGLNYYSGRAYLLTGVFGTSTLIIVPITSAIDTAVDITVSQPVGANVVVAVYGDTAIYDESVFYNGQMQNASVSRTTAGTTTLVSGPARIISTAIDVDACEGYLQMIDAYTGAATYLTHMITTGGGNNGLTQSFTPNLILPIGGSIQAVLLAPGGSPRVTASVTYAYP